jgi:putative DNA primase/helicase
MTSARDRILADLPNVSPNGADAGEALDPLPGEPHTELGYARRLVAAFGDRLRYVPAWRRWLVWDGRRWQHESTGQEARWQKVIARSLTSAAMAIPDETQRKAALHLTRRGEAAAGVAGALKLASTEPAVAVSPDELDANPHLLNCRNGVLDLRDGQLRPHDPAQLLTKLAGADYHPDASGPTFKKFLETIQPDESMRAFLARLLGHALEGRVSDHLLPIFYGLGANGKSTLTDAVTAALGDYADAADPDLLTARSFDAHPTGVADLFGLRVAVLHESDNGRRLAEGTVKRLTGGDAIKARRMREDFWSFTPSHTFVMLTNHKPLVTGTDEGIWRRLRLVPFDVVIPLKRRDARLPDKLATEVDAILAWLVAGHAAWREQGLADPDAVIQATADYRAESDAVARFVDERCLVGPNFHVRSSELYRTWAIWCEREGVEAGTNKAFTIALQNRGYDTRRTEVGAVWRGIAIAAEADGS